MPFLRKLGSVGHISTANGNPGSVPPSGQAPNANNGYGKRKLGQPQLEKDVRRNSSLAGTLTPQLNSPGTSRSNKTASLLSDDLTVYTFEDAQVGLTGGSRKSSSENSNNNNSNSLSFDKLILSWDPTDPKEWTLQRVISWLKFHEFPDSWVSTFMNNQLSGHNFIKLLVYDNFQIYEHLLPEGPLGSFTRFQLLLKQTMSKNVTNNHIRQRSNDKSAQKRRTYLTSSSTRSSSDSTKHINESTKSQVVDPGSRSASESAVPHTQGEKKPSKTPQSKTKGPSSLYRRSFISLRGYGAGTNTENIEDDKHANIKLNIPLKSFSNLNPSSNNSSAGTNGGKQSSAGGTSTHSPLSPSYPGIFRRHHKSSSSESSLRNAIFGSNHLNSSNNIPAQPNAITNTTDEGTDARPTYIHNNLYNQQHHGTRHTRNSSQPNPSAEPHHKRHSVSSDTLLSPRKLSTSSSASSGNAIDTSVLRPPRTEEKETLWGKFKRRSQIYAGYSPLTATSSPSTVSSNTLTPTGGTPSSNNGTSFSNGASTASNTNSSKPNSNLAPVSKPSSTYNGIATSLEEKKSLRGIPPKAIHQNKLKLNPAACPKRRILQKSNPNKEQRASKSPKAPNVLNNERNIDATKQPRKLHDFRVSDESNRYLKKYYPNTKNNDADNAYIFVTRDSKNFILLNVNKVRTSEELKSLIAKQLNFSSMKFSIHMTDFNNSLGSPIPDDVLSIFHQHKFGGTTKKFYIKDNSTPRNRSRAATLQNEPPHQLRSMGSKNSVLSRASSGVTDDVSIATSTSDLTSFDDHTGNDRRYPPTPSIYHDPGNTATPTNSNEEQDYWSIKQQILPELDSTPLNPTFSMKMPGRLKTNTRNDLEDNDDKTPTASTADEARYVASSSPIASSFQVLRKDETGEIDFNKRRESPYVNPELAPRREAPKPPTSNSPQKSTTQSKGLLWDDHTLEEVALGCQKSTEPVVTTTKTAVVQSDSESPSTERIVSSYTPGSTHVLVPQPYKGATEALRKKNSEDDISYNPVSNFLMKQRANRSNSTASTTSSVLRSNSVLLKRNASKRIVSSTSAADVFVENNINFDDAPELSDDNDSSSSDDIIWSTNNRTNTDQKMSIDKNESDSEKDNIGSDHDEHTIKTPSTTLTRKMTLRPSPEEVYENLERFFPRANLDKPIVEGIMSPTSPKSTANMIPEKLTCPSDEDIFVPTVPLKRQKAPKRTKTIRTIAHEASEARKSSLKLKRKNTKMWGTRMVEVTEKHMVSINKSKNSRGEYKEFAWMKGEMIGKGSFGAVYLCLNLTTGEMMAVKQVEVPKYSAQDQNILDTVEALRSEVSTLKDLDHLNIVQYLGFENDHDIYSLFLEYVGGGSVGSLIRLYGRFDEALIRFLTVQVLEGLAYLHSKGILHRDMKADNLLLDLDGVCKISDFGISRKSKDIYSNSDMTMRGTVFWMAPEMVDTKQGYSAKVDIWSLGCVVLEMFAGKRPWSNLEVVAAMFKIGKNKSAPPIPEDTLPLISQDGRQFLNACFEIDPDLRPTADKLLSHPFSSVYDSFDFKSTKLAQFIKSNDKINSSKLRVTSQESLKKDY
ncbi:mitogen-activated protein kinase kinase kinase BCK1 KNAG_0B01780 [Huiozyma naganishii CBS 8797]|uniref:Protein kinase domain-containing protein n=1 Tax=Huiozyma naganishii (strain ATCC MYA-139 / BCRC 22969 / CBS 8797 / KCTC 17520 / NBRC 10181 / NCYC 3082 / Yp74L-3) TaxID=1071383 RepID=J7S4K1_HUIN7|nr:hypothetical protein KNAG_0B01780 [Kazachstania naganishii CBS 8797]CCK68621.1 hypothetical protein KNAG_0B01780 [Kazachstania naganishii CBS 8797]